MSKISHTFFLVPPQPEHLPATMKFTTIAPANNPTPGPAAVIPVLEASDTEQPTTVTIDITLDASTAVNGGSTPILIDIGCHTDNDPGNPASWVDFTDSGAPGNIIPAGKSHQWVELDNNNPVLLFHDAGPLTLTLHVYYYPTALFPRGRNHVDLYILAGSLAPVEGSVRWTILRVFRHGSAKPADPRPANHP